MSLQKWNNKAHLDLSPEPYLKQPIEQKLTNIILFAVPWQLKWKKLKNKIKDNPKNKKARRKQRERAKNVNETNAIFFLVTKSKPNWDLYMAAKRGNETNKSRSEQQIRQEE